MSIPAFHRSGSRRGVSLVELMIAMLILAIVCIGWMQIIGMKSARKEARRREAVERLAGMMDAFLYERKNDAEEGCWRVEIDGNRLSILPGDSGTVRPVFGEEESSVGYRLEVVTMDGLDDAGMFSGWDREGDKMGLWLVGRLYDNNGALADCGYPFFTLPVCLGL